jgi:hypothetical protein
MSRDDARPPRRPSARGAARTPSAAPAESTAPGRTVSPRIRVRRGDEIALGPGKVALLEAIHSGGSLTVAARGLGMSYMRAWKLVQTMNACFREPLVTTQPAEAPRTTRPPPSSCPMPAARSLSLFSAGFGPAVVTFAGGQAVDRLTRRAGFRPPPPLTILDLPREAGARPRDHALTRQADRRRVDRICTRRDWPGSDRSWLLGQLASWVGSPGKAPGAPRTPFGPSATGSGSRARRRSVALVCRSSRRSGRSAVSARRRKCTGRPGCRSDFRGWEGQTGRHPMSRRREGAAHRCHRSPRCRRAAP